MAMKMQSMASDFMDNLFSNVTNEDEYKKATQFAKQAGLDKFGFEVPESYENGGLDFVRSFPTFKQQQASQLAAAEQALVEKDKIKRQIEIEDREYNLKKEELERKQLETAMKQEDRRMDLMGEREPSIDQLKYEKSMADHVRSDKFIQDFQDIKVQSNKVDEIWNKYMESPGATDSMNALDQSMIMIFQKILDPTSVVRESEFARLAGGQSLYNRGVGYLDRLQKGGGGLSPGERKEIYETIGALTSASKKLYDKKLAKIKKGIPKRYHKGIFTQFEDDQPLTDESLIDSLIGS